VTGLMQAKHNLLMVLVQLNQHSLDTAVRFEDG
jgi:hypothetical protein